MANRETIYHVLTPKTDLEESVYFGAIDFALKDESVRNIAITGPYGAGKSSIIHSYLQKRKQNNTKIVGNKNIINDITITLANIASSEDSNLKIIEYAILEQLFFHKSCEQLPESQFSRIKCISKWDLMAYVFFSVFGFACIFTWFYQDNLNLYFPGYVALPLFSFLLALLVYKVFPILRNLSIRKLSLATASIEIGDKDDQSILNQHLDEIIYFFQATRTNIIIFEDLDRFNNPELFVKLREINYLINNSEIVEQNVVFIYALRDDLFCDKQRTKFFDFIVPIIPYVDGENAVDKLYSELKSEGVSSKLCEILSYYIGDMRMVYNISNEFHIYKALKSNEADFDINKMLAIVAYKNCYPDDFSKLTVHSGILYTIIREKDKVIKHEKDVLCNKISELEKQVQIRKDFLNTEIKSLRLMYLTTLLVKANPDAVCFYENGVCRNLNYMSSDAVFNNIILGKSITYVYIDTRYNNPQKLNFSYNFTDIEKIIDPNCTYKEKEQAILDRDSIEQKQEEISKYKTDLLKLENCTYKHLLDEGNSLEVLYDVSKEDVNDETAFKRQVDLIEDLLSFGFINENYRVYLSLFHEGTIGANDRRFLIDVMRNKKNVYDYKLEQTDQLLERIDDYYFLQTSAVWNYDLIDALMLANDRSNKKCEYLFDNLKNNKGGLEFINEYVQHGKRVDVFIDKLCEKYPNIWKDLHKNNIIIDDELWLNLLLCYANITQVIKIFDQNEATFACDADYFLRINIPKEKLRKVVQLLQIKFKAVNPEISKDDKEFIIANNLYEINKGVIENLIPFTYDKDQFELCNYTFLQNKALSCVLKYIKANFTKYINEIWLQLPYQCDSEDNVLEILQYCEDTEISPVLILKHTQLCIQDVKTIINKKLALKPFLETCTIKPTWDNIKSIYLQNEKQLPDYLIQYLNKSEIYESMRGCVRYNWINSANTNIETDLFMTLLYSEDLLPQALTTMLGVESKLELWDANKVSLLKIEALIKSRLISPKLSTFSLLRKEYEDAHIKLLKNNFADVVGNFDSTISFSAEEIDMLSKVNLHTAQYKKLLKYIMPDAIRKAKNLYFIVAAAERKNADITLEKVIAILDNNNVEQQKRIQLFIMYSDNINNDEISKFLQSLGKPYSNIAIKQAKIPKGDEQLLQCLQDKNYISSFKLERNEYYRVYLRKSRIR